MRAEACGKMNAVLKLFGLASGKGEIRELGRKVGEVGNGRRLILDQRFHHHRIFDSRTQSVAGEALGVGNGHLAGFLTEGFAQSLDLGIGASAAGRGVGLVGHEDGFRCVLASNEAVALLHAGDKASHLFREVLLVDAGGVEGAVADVGSKNIGLAFETTVKDGVFSLHDKRDSASAEDGAVALGVEGLGGLGDVLFDAAGTHGQEAGGDPGGLGRVGGGFTTNHNDALAAAGTDPVFCGGARLGGGGAGAGEKQVGTLGLDHLRKVGRTQGNGVDDELTVELIRGLGLLLLQTEEPVGEATLNIGIRYFLHEIVVHGLHLFEGLCRELLTAISLHFAQEGLPPLKKRGHDDTGGRLHLFGQGKALADGTPTGSGGPTTNQGNARVAQGINACGHAEADADVVVVLDAEIFTLEVSELACKLDHLVKGSDGHHAGVAIGRLVNTHDVLVEHGAALSLGEAFDHVLTADDAVEVGVGKNGSHGTGQADGDAGDGEGAGVETEILDFTQALLAARLQVLFFDEGLQAV